VNHWFYDATAGGEGTYRATFVADPGASTVYGIFYFEVGSPTVDPDAGVGDAAVADGGLSDSGPAFDSLPGSDGAPDNHQGVAGGCNCRTGSENLPVPLVWALLAWLWQRRRLRHM
jgi:MYXO-CTERM domain-containing protein